jgi:hypothetical protein
MSYRSVLCATVASFMAAGCFETSRKPWMQQTTLVSEQRQIPPHTAARKKLDTPAEDRGRAVRPRNAKEGECGTPEECASLLRTMVGDPTRSWMRQRPSFAAYANGTRLFAYRAVRAKLDCNELGMALDEIEAAAQPLANPPTVIPVERVIKIRALSAEVGSELHAELASRCASGTKVFKG